MKIVAIIGAGPVGLAAGCHALERGWTPLVIEQGPEAGHAVAEWGHVRMFSPWKYNMDGAAQRLLAATGWTPPDPEAYPTGRALIGDYLRPLAADTPLRDRILTDCRVEAISRKGFDKVRSAGREAAPFEITARRNGALTTLEAHAVIDASGTWFSPAPAGAGGLAASGEQQCGDRIAYGMPDIAGRDSGRYRGKTVAVLGAGHSALGVLIDLAKSGGPPPVWLTRRDTIASAFGGGSADQLAERGALGLAFADLVQSGRVRVETGFRVARIERMDGGIAIIAQDGREVAADELVVSTGFRPELGFLRELRVALDPALECPPALAPLIDPNEHSCGTVRPHGARELAHPEPGFYIAGMKSYGRAPTFLMMTGYEQVRSIMAALAGDQAAADRVELVLPETGVCSAAPSAPGEGCCGGPPATDSEACCRADETAKLEGRSGCGCGDPETQEKAAACCG
jgi:thioredoxin reductase